MTSTEELHPTAEALLDAATALLDEEGRDAVTARRLGREIGASSMAVYTHFGSMDELMAAIWRRGFARFGAALASASTTADPVADWMVQGWAYRRFALANPHLYRVMFSDGLFSFTSGTEADRAAAAATFLALLERIERCVEGGRWDVADVALAGEVVWMATHGHCSVELTGYFSAVERDPEVLFAEATRRLSLGFGDDPEQAAASSAAARRRARRAARS
jgi:AcrR family transcriptional regulator